MPTPDEVARLGIPAGTPVAELIRTGYTAVDKPVLVMISIIPGDTLILQCTIPNEPRNKVIHGRTLYERFDYSPAWV
jgi:hypothetical protein